jgi:hypothetical protein
MRRAAMPGPLPALVEALAPLGMPDVRHDSRRRHGNWVSRICAAMHLPRSWARSSVISDAAAPVQTRLPGRIGQ